MTTTRYSILAAFVFALLISGCGGGDDKLELIPVTGNVTLNGQPLAGAMVNFLGTDGLASTGLTDSAGNYVLKFDDNQPGCLAGPKVVNIVMGGADEEGADPDAPDAKIPDRYNRKTELTADVSDDNRTFDFKLTSP
jgi:hypothetical protein